MSCPTCGHTMQGIGEVPAVGGDPTFWCPRCGTLHQPARLMIEPPVLVKRCRDLRAIIHAGGYLVIEVKRLQEKWHQLGLDESIRTPEERT